MHLLLQQTTATRDLARGCVQVLPDFLTLGGLQQGLTAERSLTGLPVPYSLALGNFEQFSVAAFQTRKQHKGHYQSLGMEELHFAGGKTKPLESCFLIQSYPHHSQRESFLVS